MEIEALRRPLSIGGLRDGCAYVRPAVPLAQTNLFLKVGRVDELFIKVPSEYGYGEFRTFAREGRVSVENVREGEAAERLEPALQRFSALQQLTPIGKELAHYLAVHKIQYERLKSQIAVGIPEARFGVLRSTRFRIFCRYEPALFQQPICGTTLWDMFDFSALRVAEPWRRFLPAISAQLSPLLGSRIWNHIDWNIQNFVFEEATERLFYVDLKPTAFLTKQSFEHNLKGVRDYFIV